MCLPLYFCSDRDANRSCFLIQNWELILSLVAIVMIGKFLIVVPLVSIFRYPLRVAIFAGLGLAQIGEFSLYSLAKVRN